MQEFIVSTLNDENDDDFSVGDLSLREAIALAESDDTITFDNSLSGGTISLSLEELLIERDVTIQGLGADRLSISGNDASRVFNIDDGNAETFLNIDLDGLTITGGRNSSFVPPITDPDLDSALGGGILNQENLNLSNSKVTDNQSGNQGGGIFNGAGTLNISSSQINNNSAYLVGGGIGNDTGTVTITNSTIDGNAANGDRRAGSTGGGIINNGGDLDINSSTISNNSAQSSTGGIENYGSLSLVNSTVSGNDGGMVVGGIKNNSTGTVSIRNSTIVDNRGGLGASGLQNNNSDIDGITIFSTIIADNIGNADISGEALTSIEGSNIIGSSDETPLFIFDGIAESRDIVGSVDSPVDPGLGELQDNGGDTLTHLPLLGSVTINNGNNGSIFGDDTEDLPNDQRGDGFERTFGDGTDVGAVELQEITPSITPIVTTLDDEADGDLSPGDISLREAISFSSEGDTVTFDPSLSGGTIDLSLGDLVIDKSLNVEGLGADQLTIDAGDNSNLRIFKIDDGNSETLADVKISGLTITGGNVGRFFGSSASTFTNGDGGGIFNAENLAVDSSVISDNNALLSGGGIFNLGRLNLTNSTVDNNSVSTPSIFVSSDGGGIVNSGGFANISNSTISNNVGTQSGGISSGGEIFDPETQTTSGAILNVANSTITGNSGMDIQGLPEPYSIGAGAGVNGDNGVTIVSSIIANNETDIVGDVTSNGNNLVGNAEDFTGAIESDLVGTVDNPIDPLLGELQDNGGTTPTQALLEDSPAIDAGSNPENLATDQRGEGFARTVGEGTDIGAFEVQGDGGGEIPTDLVVSILEDENDGDFSEGDLSLREAIALAESDDTITFDSSLSGGTISLSQGELLIQSSLAIEGLGADSLTIDASGSFSRVFNVDDGNNETSPNVSIDGLTITGGSAFFGMPGDVGGVGNRELNIGGGISNSENLNLSNSLVTGNSANQAGGGIYNSGLLSVDNSTVSNNYATSARAGGVSGGIFSVGTLSVENSTVSNNVSFRNGGINSSGTATITNSTISNNSSFINTGGIAGSATITSSIVANNTIRDGDNFAQNDLLGEFVSGGNNLIGNSNNSTGFSDRVNGDLVGTVDNPIDPLLGELQDNGGTTPTQALLENSPAIDAGSNPNDLATDQRGEGFDRTVGEGTDIGAFEVQETVTNPDLLEGTAGNDSISGTDRDEEILGLAGNDNLNGNGGADTISGGIGDDTLFGGTGDDSLEGNEGDDRIFGEDGQDTLDGGIGNDSLNGGADNDIHLGGEGDDLLLGSNGDDVVNGNGGDDLINGNKGDDLLVGGAGRDTLIGGNGHDTFIIESFTERDFIEDFVVGSDRLQLSESLSLEQIGIVDNNAGTGAFILDAARDNLAITLIRDVHAADLTIHEFGV